MRAHRVASQRETLRRQIEKAKNVWEREETRAIHDEDKYRAAGTRLYGLLERRDKLVEQEKARRDRLTEKRKRIADRLRTVAASKERVRLIRPYVEGFRPDDGFNMHEAKEWNARKRARIEKTYQMLAPMLLKPHVRVRARTKAQLKTLKEFQGIEKAPKGLKAVPVVVPEPERAQVTVTDDAVQVRIGRQIQRHFFVPEELEDLPSATQVARRMLRQMPAGYYFIKTGEHEAYRQGAAHDPKRPMRDNLLLRQVVYFINRYGAERVGNFFRGFRWIANLGNPEAAHREAGRFIKMRAKLDRERYERRMERYGKARRRARRIVKR